MYKGSIILSAVVASLACSVVVEARPIVIPEGTRVRIRLEERISSASIEEGQAIRLGVADDIKINQMTVIKLNSVVNGTVTESVAKRRLGRTGKLDFSVDTINAMDGGKIPVRYTIMKKEGGSHVVRTGVVAALVAMTYPPAAPLVLLATGKDVTLYRGLIFQVFTDTDYEMDFEPDEPPRKIMISITSDTPRVDLYIDDTLYGELPKLPMVTPGDRHVYKWQKNKDFCVREFAIARFLELNEVPTERGCAKK